MENKYLIFDEINDIYDINRQALFTFLLSQGFDEDIAEQWLEDDDEFTESVINSFDDLEEATEDDIEEWATTEMEFYSEGNDFLKENKMTNEQLRMQMLSGIITEGEYKVKLKENFFSNLLNKLKGSKLPKEVEKDEFDGLTDEEAKKLRIKAVSMLNGLQKAREEGMPDDGQSSSYSNFIDKLDARFPNLKESLNESMIGGIVGIGAINQIPPRAKNDYEMAFEHFLGQKYNLNEAEGDVMVDSMALASYIDELVSLADDMEYTPDMVKGLQDLKARLSGGEMSVENALDIIKQTIDITGDDIDAVEALGQAVDYDDAIVAKAREIAGLDEGKEVEEKYNY